MALRGHVFDKQLFSSDCYALVTDTFLGKQSGIIRGCDMTNTTSLIHINEGYFVVKGRPIQEEGGSNIEVEPGNIDGSYCKLVCELDMSKNNTTTELNQVSYKIVEDATIYPVLTQEDITDSGIIYQFELAKFRRTLNGIEDFVDTRSFLNFDSIYEEVRNEIKKIEDGSIFVTEEEMRKVGVAVSPTQPTTNEKVWIQKGKNLINPSNLLIGYSINLDSTELNTYENGLTTNWIRVLPNTVYSLSGGNRARYQFKNTNGVVTYGGNSNSNPHTFTTLADTEYVRIYVYDYYNTSIKYPELPYVQLEEGTTATEYKPYIRAIHIKNNNGLYEEFYNETEINDLKNKIQTNTDSITRLNDNIDIKAKALNFREDGVIKINNVMSRGAMLINITKNGGAEYGLYSIWFNAGVIVKTTQIAGNGTALTASLSDDILTLTSNAWALGFYILYGNV